MRRRTWRKSFFLADVDIYRWKKRWVTSCSFWSLNRKQQQIYPTDTNKHNIALGIEKTRGHISQCQSTAFSFFMSPIIYFNRLDNYLIYLFRNQSYCRYCCYSHFWNLSSLIEWLSVWCRKGTGPVQERRQNEDHGEDPHIWSQ